MPYVSPFFRVVRFITRWSLYTSLVTYAVNTVIGLLHFEITFPYLIPSVAGFISGCYLIITEIDRDTVIDMVFSFKNVYNKFLTKLITNLD